MGYAIEARQLRKCFRDYEAVRGVDLTVRQGELFALLGPNGAGKTTMIRMLTTLLRPDEGTALVLGKDVVTDADQVRRCISVTGQYAALDEALTGKQNLMLFAGLQGYNHKEARVLSQELLGTFGLAEAASRAVATYSGGMRRRLDLAAGIVSQPEIMFLDEPTTGLDPQSRRELWELVRSLVKQGTTVLLTTQYLEEADQLADRIGFIAEGRMIAVGTPEQLKASVGGKTLAIRLAQDSDAIEVCRLIESEHGLSGQLDKEESIVRVAVRQAELGHAVIGTLLLHRVAVEDFTMSDPSLDDVYFSLVSMQGKEVSA